jgi:hypothetical protein
MTHTREKKDLLPSPAKQEATVIPSLVPKPVHYSQVNPWARTFGVGFSAILEAYATYPLDKLKNIEMMQRRNSSQPVPPGEPTPVSTAQTSGEGQSKAQKFRTHLLKNIVGPDHATLNFKSSAGIKKALQLSYRGSSGYLVYKGINRSLKFGAQPPLMEAMMHTSQFGFFANVLGFDFAKVMAATLAGSTTGIAEVVINPFDRWKLLCQKNNITMGAAFQIMKREGLAVQYSGWLETMMRNAIGTGTLCFGKFGTYYALGVEDHNRPTWGQSLASSGVGTVTMLCASHPFDLLKVRKQMQDKPAAGTESVSLKKGMVNTLFHIGRTEGAYALIAGLPTKMVGSGLKGTLIMTGCEMLVKLINSYFTVEADRPEKSSASRMSM